MLLSLTITIGLAVDRVLLDMACRACVDRQSDTEIAEEFALTSARSARSGRIP